MQFSLILCAKTQAIAIIYLIYMQDVIRELMNEVEFNQGNILDSSIPVERRLELAVIGMAEIRTTLEFLDAFIDNRIPENYQLLTNAEPGMQAAFSFMFRLND